MKQVRICEFCQHHNSLGTTFCENPDCGEDVSYLPITTVDEEGTDERKTLTHTDRDPVIEPVKTVRMSGIQLVNTASGFEVEIPVGGGIIGRSGTIHAEHFQSNPYVSNQHARISLNATGYVLTDLNSTNGTKVNGRPIASGENIQLRDRDIVTFANLEYEVREV